MMRRLLRGSSSQSSKDKQKEENKKPKYNLPRTAEVWPCEWPCNEFLEAVEIYKTLIIWRRMHASPTSSTTSVNSISCSLIFSRKTFIFMLRNHHLQWSFIYMMRLRRCRSMNFVKYVRYPLLVVLRNHIVKMLRGLSI